MVGKLAETPVTDFTRHNEEVQKVWDSYNAGRPIRVPFGRFTLEPRIWLQDSRLNTAGVTWRAFFDDPDQMFRTLLAWSHHVAHNIPHDIEMGIPAKEWAIYVWFSNVGEEAWLGCPVHFPDGQVPSTTPRYTGKDKEALFEHGIPGPFDGYMARYREYHDYFVSKARNFEFCGRPVTIWPPNPITPQGLLTVAVGVCGSELLEDMLVNEDYYHRVMDLVTTATIERIKAWRSYLGLDPMPQQLLFADDAIQHISVRTYREKVLPYHRRLVGALAGDGPHHIHLCGHVQRHFPTLINELNVKTFDTGYPIDFATLRDEVGDDVEIWGGVPVANLLADSPEQIYAKCVAILRSGIMRGGKFILKEANNVPPMTPPENLAAMYRAVKEEGIYHYGA
jgi:hypothetical protein